MSRDHRKLRVFVLADELVERVYVATRTFPASERFGLQARLRRTAVSVPTNLVEGSARRSTREYLSFVNVAAASAAEARYLVDLGQRLGYIGDADAQSLMRDYTELVSRLVALVKALSLKP